MGRATLGRPSVDRSSDMGNIGRYVRRGWYRGKSTSPASWNSVLRSGKGRGRESGERASERLTAPEDRRRAELAGLALLARRWGSTVEAIRDTLSDEQFNAYLSIEVEALEEERALSAIGVHAAIAQLLAAKGNDPLKRYLAALKGPDAAPAMSGSPLLRSRLHAILEAQERKK